MEPDTKGHPVYDSIYMKFKNRQNESMGLKVRTVVTSGWKTLTGRGYEGSFQGDGNILYLDLSAGYIHVRTL